MERLLRDVTLMTLASAIALGWSLFQVAQGLGYLILEAVRKNEGPALGLSFASGHHIFEFDRFLLGLVEFCVVVAVILIARRQIDTRPN